MALFEKNKNDCTISHLIFGDLLLGEVDPDDRFRRRSLLAPVRVGAGGGGGGDGGDGARATLHEVRLTLLFVVALEAAVKLQELVVDVGHPEVERVHFLPPFSHTYIALISVFCPTDGAARILPRFLSFYLPQNKYSRWST